MKKIMLMLSVILTTLAFFASRSHAAPQAASIVIIGDSIIHNARGFYPNGIVNAHNGRGSVIAGYGTPDWYVEGWGDYGTGLEAVTQFAPSIPVDGWLVMEIGTNDIVSAVSIEDYKAFVLTTVEMLPDDRCLAWVIPWVGGDYQTVTDAVVQVLRDIVPQQPCHQLIEWGSVVSAASTTLTTDGVHPNETGAAVLASMIYTTTNN